MKKRNDTYQSIRDEREYGPYWYNVLWRVVRPVLVLAGSLLLVAGIVVLHGAISLIIHLEDSHRKTMLHKAPGQPGDGDDEDNEQE